MSIDTSRLGETAKTGAAQFDCPDIYAEHAFLVRLARGRMRGRW